MKNFIEMLKKLFAGDDAKTKLLDDFAKDIPADPPNKIDLPSSNDPVMAEMQKTLTAMTEQNKKYLEMLEKLEQKDADREKQLQAQAQTELNNKISKLLDDAKADGRIPAKNEELEKKYKALLEKDFESAKTIIDGMQKTTVKKVESGTDTAGKLTDTPKANSRPELVNSAVDYFNTNKGDRQ